MGPRIVVVVISGTLRRRRKPFNTSGLSLLATMAACGLGAKPFTQINTGGSLVY
jgi:hypothetical protein